MSVAARVNLFGLDRTALRARFAEMGVAPYRADQVMSWIYRYGLDNFDGMSNLSKDFRAQLASLFTIEPPRLITEQQSKDGTRKWLLDAGHAQAIECVFIPEGERTSGPVPRDAEVPRYRGTLCISSQVGCAMDCSFCATGAQGFSRNLSTAEIVAQVWFAAKTMGQDVSRNERVITNVVFMGMGEPLANFNEVLPALRILLDDFGFGLSKRKVTVSTSGLVPFMDRLREEVDTAMAVSLHAPNDELRNELVPINRKYPLAELMAACKRYTDNKDRKAHIVYEYVMLDGINDRPEHARQLAKLLNGLPAKVNLIPFNPFPETKYRRSPAERIRAFSGILRAKDILTTTRKTRGDDIDAACGQLAGKVVSRQRQRLRDIPVKVAV